MQFALLIYHFPEEFDMRKNDYSDPHLGAWRAYYKALVEARGRDSVSTRRADAQRPDRVGCNRAVLRATDPHLTDAWRANRIRHRSWRS